MNDDHQAGCDLDERHRDFAMFVRAHLNSYFLPLARRYVGSAMLDAAPDIAQGALAIAWSKWPLDLVWYPCTRRCGFVCKTMSNLAHEERRGRRRTGTLTDPCRLPETPTSAAGPEDRYLAAEAVRAVEHALATLPPQERLIIDLAIARLSHQEIADLLGITKTNVATRLLRARTRLARHLSPDQAKVFRLKSVTDLSGGVA